MAVPKVQLRAIVIDRVVELVTLKGGPPPVPIDEKLRLREDLMFDSIDIAELALSIQKDSKPFFGPNVGAWLTGEDLASANTIEDLLKVSYLRYSNGGK